jgi:hypothetical protein
MIGTPVKEAMSLRGSLFVFALRSNSGTLSSQLCD